MLSMASEDRNDDVEREWVGGRYVFPEAVGPGAPSEVTAAILWMELPERTIVTITVVTAEDPVSVAESFDQARYVPDDGEPREPTRIRVGDEQFANELVTVAGDIPITIAPVPELDAAFEGLVNAIRLMNAARFADDDDFLPHPVTAPAPAAGRNDPCPCGSGRKYKKCHLERDEEPRRAHTIAKSIFEMNVALCDAIQAFGREHFPADWPDFSDCSEGANTLLPIWQPWTITIGGTQVASRFFEERGRRLSPEQREWFAAQQQTWLGLWEIKFKGDGRLELVDLLSGQQRTVYERLLSALVPEDRALLGRIVDFRGASHFGGLYAGDLSLAAAAQLVSEVRAELGLADGPLPVERLRDDRVGWAVFRAWEAAIQAEQ